MPIPWKSEANLPNGSMTRGNTMTRTTMTRRRVLTGAAGITLAASFGTGVRAQTAWPDKPVRVVVPYAPGGGADTLSRLLFAKLQNAGNALAYSAATTGTLRKLSPLPGRGLTVGLRVAF